MYGATCIKVDCLYLSEAIDKKVITFDMTVKEIRDTVKVISNGDVLSKEKVIENISKDIKEEDIPMAYDVKKHYDFSYFEKISKSQLLNIVWELQTEYEKLKKKK